MATDSTAICNLALLKMGQNLIDDIAGSDVLEEKCNLIYTQTLEEVTVIGPEKGWKFAKRRNRMSVESITITAFTLASATTTTVTGTHALVAGDLVIISGTTSYNDTYEVVSISTTVSFVITETFVADDATGTAKWTSEEYAYRFPMPPNILENGMKSVNVGGVELTDWIEEGIFILTNQEDTEVDMQYIQNVTLTTLFPAHFTKVLVLYLAIELHYNLTQDLKAIQLLAAELDIRMPKAIAMDERGKYVKEFSSSWVEAGNKTDNIE